MEWAEVIVYLGIICLVGGIFYLIYRGEIKDE